MPRLWKSTDPPNSKELHRIQNLEMDIETLRREKFRLEKVIQEYQVKEQNENAEWGNHLANINNLRDLLEQEKVRLEGVIQTKQVEAQKQEGEWRYKEDQYLANIVHFKDRLKKEKAKCDEVIRKNQVEAQKQMAKWNNLEERYKDELKQERVKRDEVIRKNQVEIQNQKEKWEDRYRQSLSNADKLQAQKRKEYEESIKTMRIEHDKEICDERRMREKHESEMQNLKGKIQSLETRAEEREKDFISKRTLLERDHRIKQDELKVQQERLKKDIQSRNRALIARDNFSPITDGELKSMFSDLVREVDALAGLKWTLNQSPWTDEIQSQVSDTPKQLQKNILQDTIWTVLFEMVFCSPFRVFGKEGSELESQWNVVFGKDSKTNNDCYTWPEPSFDAERWRYETMGQCQEALRTLTSKYDPRTELRKGFQSSMKIICEILGAELETVSMIDEKTKQTIEDITEKAAKMWVAFNTQRYRLLVVIQDLKTIEEVKKGPGKQDKSTELMTQPELRRIGDVEGQSLDKEQTVAGCEGEIKKMRY